MLTRDRGRFYSPAKIFGCAFATVLATSAALAFDVKRLDNSVVRVAMFELKDGKRQDSYGIGTGFVVDREYIVTNYHVIDDSQIKKRNNKPEYAIFDGSESNLRAAQLVWGSPDLDLAVIRVPGLTRPAVTLSSAPMAEYPGKAEIVWAIGYPALVDRTLKSDEGSTNSTVTKGVVAKVANGSMSGGVDKVRPVIQHDASFNKGNSGGPLFDDCGLVVGVNTFAPYAILQIDKQQDGRDVAHGMPNTGIFFSPHIGNFIQAHKTAPQLKAVNISVSDVRCPTAMGETGGLPVWVYAAIGLVALLAIGATVLALRKGTTREVVRMVESYSAYVKRKGRPPSDESMQPRRVSSPPDITMPGPSGSGPKGSAASAAPASSKAAAGGWKFDGKGSKGQAVRISISAEDMDRAMAKKEAGIILGRSGTLADIVVEDETVSRRHAKIYVTEAGLALEDLKSAYGTEVNGHKIEAFQAVEIKPGDRVKLGGVELAFARAK